MRRIGARRRRTCHRTSAGNNRVSAIGSGSVPDRLRHAVIAVCVIRVRPNRCAPMIECGCLRSRTDRAAAAIRASAWVAGREPTGMQPRVVPVGSTGADARLRSVGLRLRLIRPTGRVVRWVAGGTSVGRLRPQAVSRRNDVPEHGGRRLEVGGLAIGDLCDPRSVERVCADDWMRPRPLAYRRAPRAVIRASAWAAGREPTGMQPRVVPVGSTGADARLRSVGLRLRLIRPTRPVVGLGRRRQVCRSA